MKHRYYRKHDITFGECWPISQPHCHGVQEDRTVAIEDAFGVAGRARGVAHSGGSVFIKSGPLIGGRLIADEGLIVNRGLQFASCIRSIAHNDVQLHCWKLIAKLFQYWHEIAIDEDDLVFSIVDNIDQLLSKETDVERVQNG